MATTWIEAGSAETQNMNLWLSSTPSGSGTITSDAQAVQGSVRSIKFLSAGGVSDGGFNVTPAGVAANAGTRATFYIRLSDVAPTNDWDFVSIANSALSIFAYGIAITTTGKLAIYNLDSGLKLATGATTLLANTDYRISFAFSYTSTTVNSMTVFLNGVSEVTASNTTFTAITTSKLMVGMIGNVNVPAKATNAFFAHFYVDNGSFGDIGDIRVTAKRPFSNGTANGFTTTGTGSGYGTGHAVQVNERPQSDASFCSVIAAGVTTEEFNIESASVGDIDLTEVTIKDYTGWVRAKSLLSETASLILNNVTSNAALTSTTAYFTQIAGSTTYPANSGTDIGVSTTALATTVTLYECGVMVAYTSAAANTVPAQSNMISQMAAQANW